MRLCERLPGTYRHGTLKCRRVADKGGRQDYVPGERLLAAHKSIESVTEQLAARQVTGEAYRFSSPNLRAPYPFISAY